MIKSATKKGTEVTLNLSLNIIDDFNDGNNFPHKSLLTNTQVSRLCKAFANNSSANRKLSKTQLQKVEQPGEFLGRFLGPLLKTESPLIGNLLEPLAKGVLIPLGLTAAASETDAAIQKKNYGSHFTTLLISNEEIKDVMKIDKSLEESRLLIKGVSETIQNTTKEQKGGFFHVLLGTNNVLGY